MKQVCVVIPVHKTQPDNSEIISLQSCREVLAVHDIFILAPESLDVSAYLQILPEAVIKYVDPKWLKSIQAYNKLKISFEFYHLFEDYEFLLTFELDAYVFRDELIFWCKKKIDYLGAPWFTGYHSPTDKAKITGVGNSGLSLRNIQTCLKVLNHIKKLNLDSDSYNFPTAKQVFRLLTLITRGIPVTQAKLYIIRAYLHNEYVHEDIFWCKFVPLVVPNFKIASIQDALKFSFDASPKKCFELSGGVLPFGCHAWHKFDPEFWQQFIPEMKELRLC